MHARARDDFVILIEKRPTQAPRYRAPDSGFTGPHEPDQKNVGMSLRILQIYLNNDFWPPRLAA